MHIFYEPDQISDHIILNEVESRHCVKVLRLPENEIVYTLDGKGNLYECKISESNHKKCLLEIIEKKAKYNKRNYHLHIAIAPTKNIERFEWFLEKTTEIGIDEITPIICEHSERKVIKPERLEKIIISAMKQSLNTYQPILHPLTDFSDFIEKNKDKGNKYIAHCYDKDKTKIKDLNTSETIVLIGPEGDFSIKEVEQAKNYGYKYTDLGINRFRTETAGIIAATAIAINHS